MIHPFRSLGKVFDGLARLTSEETTHRTPYADSRTDQGVYSIARTQTSETTYGAGEQVDRDETTSDRRTESTDSEEPVSSPTRQSVPTHD